MRCAASSREEPPRSWSSTPRTPSTPSSTSPASADVAPPRRHSAPQPHRRVRTNCTPRGGFVCSFCVLDGGWTGTGSALALLADAHVEDDRGALEAIDLAEAADDVPPVARVEEPGREHHECRRAARRLRAEEDARLLAATDRVRMRGREL